MEKVKVAICRWLGIDRELVELHKRFSAVIEAERESNAHLGEHIKALEGRIEDLEAAYPDYNKAKEQAEENKSKEIVPGFRPFTQRKRAWEAQHRKPAEKK